MKLITKYIFLFLILSAVKASAHLNALTLQFIEKTALSVSIAEMDSVFVVMEDPQFPGPAASRKMPSGQYVMKKNPKIFDKLPKLAQRFIYYHELGHYYLGHLDVPYLDDSNYRRKIELEADAFAAYMYKRIHSVDQEILDFIELEAKRSSWPTGLERAQILRSILK